MSLRKIVFALFLFMPLGAFATVNSTVQWDVKTTGSATNGGGFDPAVVSPGTDESQGSGTSVSCTVQATTTQVICVPAISSTTHGPGNVIGPLTGSGCTTSAWLEILSQSSGTATLSSTAGTNGSVCTGTLGGSLADIKNIIVANGETDLNKIWIQNGTYTYTLGMTFPSSNGLQIEGYQTTHGDLGTAPLLTTASNITLFTAPSNKFFLFKNIAFSSTAGTRGVGFSGSTSYLIFSGCTLTGFSSALSSGSFILMNSSVQASTAVGITSGNGSIYIYNSKVQGGLGGVGAVLSSSNPSTTVVVNSIITGNVGIGLDFTGSRSAQVNVLNSTIANNTGDGLFLGGFTSSNPTYGTTNIQGNVFYGNGGYGINSAAFAAFNFMVNQNNAYGSNSPSARNNWPAGTNDVTLTANPFTNSGTGDYSLNNTAGGGAALRAAGYPGTFLGGTPVGYRDIGAVQHQDTGGGGTASNYGFAR